MATAALVLGLLSIILFLTVIVPLLALIFGLVGLRQIKRSNGMKTGRGKAITGVVLGLLGLLGGVAAWVAIGAEVANTTSALNLKVGQCVALPDESETEVFRFDDQQCDEPHDAEVFATGDLGGGDDPYPGIDRVNKTIQDLCVPELIDYASDSADLSEFAIFTVYPQEKDWSINQHYACLVVKADGSTSTGSLAD
jgi:hypothetical protein